MYKLPLLLCMVSLTLCCKKQVYKAYKCKENCIDIQLGVQLADSSYISLKYRGGVIYRILFLKQNSGWIDLYEDPSLLIAEGYTDADGLMSTAVSCNSHDLSGDYKIYIRFYDNDQIMFCGSPPSVSVYDVPQQHKASFVLDAYAKKQIKIIAIKTAIDTFNKKEILLGSGCFVNSTLLNNDEDSGVYLLNAIVNKTNQLTLRRSNQQDNIPLLFNHYSFYADEHFTQYTLYY